MAIVFVPLRGLQTVGPVKLNGAMPGEPEAFSDSQVRARGRQVHGPHHILHG